MLEMDIGVFRFDIGCVAEFEEHEPLRRLLPVMTRDVARLKLLAEGCKASVMAYPCVRIVNLHWRSVLIPAFGMGVHSRWGGRSFSVGVVVNRTLPIQGEVQFYEPGMQPYVRVVHKGGLSRLDRTYAAVVLWANKHGVELDSEVIELYPDPLTEYADNKGRVICLVPVAAIQY